MANISPSLLFKTSALLWGIAVPGHFLFGVQNVRVGMAAAEQKSAAVNRAGRQGLKGALLVWDNWLAWSAGMAILNWKWANSGAPQSLEETAVLFLFALAHIVTGVRYGRAGVPGPAALLTSGAVASIGGYLLSQGNRRGVYV